MLLTELQLYDFPSSVMVLEGGNLVMIRVEKEMEGCVDVIQY